MVVMRITHAETNIPSAAEQASRAIRQPTHTVYFSSSVLAQQSVILTLGESRSGSGPGKVFLMN